MAGSSDPLPRAVAGNPWSAADYNEAMTAVDDHEDRLDAGSILGTPDVDNTDNGTTSSTLYLSTLTGSLDDPVQVGAFVAPPSGAVAIHLHAEILTTSTTAAGLVGFRILEDSSGTTVLDADDHRALSNSGPNSIRIGMAYPVRGLDPGSTYTAQMMFRCSLGTAVATFNANHIWVQAA